MRKGRGKGGATQGVQWTGREDSGQGFDGGRRWGECQVGGRGGERVLLECSPPAIQPQQLKRRWDDLRVPTETSCCADSETCGACVRACVSLGRLGIGVGGWVGGWVQKTLRGVPTCGNGSGLMLRGRRLKHSHQSGVDCGGRVRARVSRRPNGGWRVKLTPRGNSRTAQP